MGQKWFRLNCVKGLCTQCGIMWLPICDREFDPSNQSLVEWKAWVGETKEGELKEVVCLENKLTRPREFLFYVIPKIHKFFMHNFVAQWQEYQFKLCKKKLEEDEVWSLINFAENYSFKHQNEV